MVIETKLLIFPKCSDCVGGIEQMAKGFAYAKDLFPFLLPRDIRELIIITSGKSNDFIIVKYAFGMLKYFCLCQSVQFGQKLKWWWSTWLACVRHRHTNWASTKSPKRKRKIGIYSFCFGLINRLNNHFLPHVNLYKFLKPTIVLMKPYLPKN